MPDRIDVPENLGDLSDDDLNRLQEDLAEAAAKYVEAGTDGIDEEGLKAIEETAQAVERVTAESSARAEHKAKLQERATQAISKLQPPEQDPLAETDPQVPQPDQPTTPVEGEEDEDEDEDGQPGRQPQQPSEPSGEAVPLAADAGTPVVRDKAGKAIGRQVPTGLANRRPARVAPKTRSNGTFMLATPAAVDVPGYQPEQNLPDVSEVARLIAFKRHRMGMVPQGTREFVSLASGRKEIPLAIGSDPGENFAQLQEVQRQHAEVARSGFGDREALVASGGCCAPFTPLYDFFRTAVPASPIEDSLATVEAPRGGIRFIGCTNFRDAAAGVGFYTCADGTITPLVEKPCVHVECPPIEDAEVQAVSTCVSFDNLQYRVFPEQVESFLADLAVMQTDAKELMYLACLDANSTPVTGSTGPTGYGMYREVLDLMTRAVVRYRARAAMAVDATVIAYLPSWVRDGMAIDLVNDGDQGAQMWDVAGAQIDAMFSTRDISVVWYRDLRQGAPFPGTGAPAAPQAAGALLAWPELANAYIMAPGTFVRLDGGSLDVGLVRDSQLNRTNDLEIFAEEWIGCTMVGCESVRLTMTLCPNGSRPGTLTPYTCPAG